MAFTKVHIACGYVGAPGSAAGRSASLLNRPAWSQTFEANAPGTTGAGASDGVGQAPTSANSYGQPCFEIRSAVDIYVSVGPSPNATTGPRIFVPQNETRNVFADTGDKLAWVLAA